ncbi:MAG: DUF2059 domain-containing protein [Alphaproteobacteria bacterium]|nr:DUF2059 domain-containing protein [Alphaproteobacteria bacterium]MBV9371188.1 DUF2059 domain-containing protein [Alphaproteobacteria bacterium]MBV9899918.1 DUF2059 domain-containing protein [Alphaproteobacteria bacterium]
MRRLAAALVLTAATSLAAPCLAQSAPDPVAATAPVDPDRLAIAEEVVALAFPVERRPAMFSRINDALMSQMRAALFGGMDGPPDPGAEAIFQRYFERVRAESDRLNALISPQLFAAVARAYARAFTRDELVQIRAFAATPAGAKYLHRAPELLSDPDVAAVNTAHFQRAMDAVAPLTADARRELAAYYEKRSRPTRR